MAADSKTKKTILTLNKNVGVILRNYEKTPDKDKILEIKQKIKKLHISNRESL